MTSLPGGPDAAAPRPDGAPGLADRARLGRRDLLKAFGVLGAAAVVPVGLSACEPTTGNQPMPLPPDASVRGRGFTGGTETVIGQGGWCWFQSPRASFGPGGLLWLGTSLSESGTSADGAVQAWGFDVPGGQVVFKRTLVIAPEDDHTSPSVMALGDKVQISWAIHKPVDYLEVGETTRNGIFVSHRIHRPESRTYPGRGMSYSSVHIVGGARWLLYRGEQFSWNLLTSPDGKTWTPRGLIVTPGVVGQRPYVSAASDGSRLHVLLNDGNPTEYQGASLYAGSIGTDLKITDGNGRTIGSVGSGAPKPAQFLRLAAGSPGPSRTSEGDDTDYWTCDVRVVDGAPTGIISRRDNWPAGSQQVGGYRHQYLWVRKRGSGWHVEHLAWAGAELYDKQRDYTGLGTQDPSEPKRVVISTNVHPVSGAPLTSLADGKVHWELFEGWRAGEGTWTWTPLTANSTEDNIRPYIAAGGAYKALAWMRGRYVSWTQFDTRLVVRTMGPAADAPAPDAPDVSTAPAPTTPSTTAPSTTTTAPPPTTTSTAPPSATTSTTPATTTSVPPAAPPG